MLAAAVLAAGCTTAPVEEVAMAPGRSGTPTDTGTFPNLNIPQQAATTQFTEDEKKAKLSRLTALQPKQNPGDPDANAAAEAQRKRLKVSADNQDETLKVIEGE
ncbi:MAG: hypothetical protein NTV73_10585 [Hyphomicrobiales bacterium]|nr:hypothetical protein [Hyphomicrobiales bacterium]